MRNVLLFFGLLVSSSLSAQRFELGINGGVGFNGRLNNLSKESYITHAGSALNYADAYSLKGMYLYKNWQFGISIDHRRATYRIEQKVVFYSQYHPGGPLIIDNRIPLYAHHSKSYYPIKFLANRKVKLNHFELYGGLSAGYVILSDIKINPSISDLTVDMETKQRSADYRINHGISFTAGAQVGFTYFVGKHIGLNMEVNADYVQFRQGPHSYSEMACVPILIGLRYR